MAESFFRVSFGIWMLTFFVGQVVNVSRSTAQAGEYTYREKYHVAMQVFRKGLGLVWFAAMLAYIFKPEWVAWASYPLPGWLRVAGLVVAALGLPLLWWVERSLAENFNTTLHLRDDHRLITDGPYRRVRHPMYTAIVVLAPGWVLLPANWLVAVFPVVGFVVLMMVRIPQEEKVMLERFGDEYRAYMARTGRFLPKVRG